jgi:hypothetical protein
VTPKDFSAEASALTQKKRPENEFRRFFTAVTETRGASVSNAVAVAYG